MTNEMTDEMTNKILTEFDIIKLSKRTKKAEEEKDVKKAKFRYEDLKKYYEHRIKIDEKIKEKILKKINKHKYYKYINGKDKEYFKLNFKDISFNASFEKSDGDEIIYKRMYMEFVNENDEISAYKLSYYYDKFFFSVYTDYVCDSESNRQTKYDIYFYEEGTKYTNRYKKLKSIFDDLRRELEDKLKKIDVHLYIKQNNNNNVYIPKKINLKKRII